MSPSLNVGDSYPVISTNQYQVNDIIAFRPLAKYRFGNEKLLYAHRLVALPGDVIMMKEGKVYLNSKPYPFTLKLKFAYTVTTSMPLNEKRVEGFEYMPIKSNEYSFFATDEEIERLKKNGAVTSIKSKILEAGDIDYEIVLEGDNRDNWGPIRLPKKGDQILVTEKNQKMYESIFTEYEKSDTFMPGQRYVIGQNYYMVLGDSRHNALDSRFMGFIPEENIKGEMIID